MQKIIPLLLILYINICFGQISPEEYFGDSYNNAISYCNKNKTEFIAIFEKHSIAGQISSSIVFPELIRYNRFRDFAETSALELLYIKHGKEVADFSIGRFQMKPSFIETIEALLKRDSLLKVEFSSVNKYPTADSSEIRKIRLDRLKSQEWQFLYLACFIKLAEKAYLNYMDDNPENQLLILSSAYNRGFGATYDELKILSETKTFPYGNKHFGRYSYYDIAKFYYSNHSHKIF
ncbi:MAG: hypothetical protein F9K37_08720 [Bacteroidales bacterium]|nr:MAG: hypothetical protein F9K37_08720 [Bacteroidales bacterium]